VDEDGTPSPLMSDRMTTAIALYQQGEVQKLDLSGYPNEVSYMMNAAEKAGIPASALLSDSAGSDTRDTMLDARALFHIQKALICTQRYHLPRAVYIARSLGIDALGVPADIQPYPNTRFDSTWREWGARVKAFLQVTF